MKTDQYIYLDNNSTTRIDPRVAMAMYQCDGAGLVNPASQHGPGRAARRILETSRENIACRLGCRAGGVHADRVIFTSGGTEANNLALLGLAGEPPGRILVSAIEHPSVTAAALRLRLRGFQVEPIPVTSEGVVRLDVLDRMLAQPARLVSVMLGNNETGVLQPVREIAILCRQKGVFVHTDAVQAVGKIAVGFCHLQVDALSLGAHKFHGPRGIGALILRPGHSIEPQICGGFQQFGLRAGTESVTLAVGMDTALGLWQAAADHRLAQLSSCRDALERAICAELPMAVVNGAAAPRLPHTSNISFPGLDRQSVAMALDLAGVACSTGSACASGSSEPSPVLLAMGLSQRVVDGAVRFSVGADTEPAEIDRAASRILKVINDLYRRKEARNPSETSRH